MPECAQAVIPRSTNGSDFASRWLILNYGAKGYVGQVGASLGVLTTSGKTPPGASGQSQGLSGASPYHFS
jgi:hypothetical protein